MRLGLGSRLCCCAYTHKLLGYSDLATVWKRDYLDGQVDDVGATESVIRLESGASGQFAAFCGQMNDGRGALSLYNSNGGRIWQTLENTTVANTSWYTISLAYGASDNRWATVVNGVLQAWDGTDGSELWSADDAPSGWRWGDAWFDADGNVYVIEADTVPVPFTTVYENSRIIKYDSAGNWVSETGKTVTRVGLPIIRGDELYFAMAGSPQSFYGYRRYALDGTLSEQVSQPMTGSDNWQTLSIEVDSAGAVYLLTGTGSSSTVRKIVSGSEAWATTVSTPASNGRLKIDESTGELWWHNWIAVGADAMRSFDTDDGSALDVSERYSPSNSVTGRDFCLVDTGVVWGGVRWRKV